MINLETSITRSDDIAHGKAVHYRMTPENIPCLAAARPDACALANNHALDFGHRGLTNTLDALAAAGIAAVGAGRTAGQARQPAIVTAAGGGWVIVFSFGDTVQRHSAGLSRNPRPGLRRPAARPVRGDSRRGRRPGATGEQAG